MLQIKDKNREGTLSCQTQVIMSQLNTSKNIPNNVTINLF